MNEGGYSMDLFKKDKASEEYYKYKEAREKFTEENVDIEMGNSEEYWAVTWERSSHVREGQGMEFSRPLIAGSF